MSDPLSCEGFEGWLTVVLGSGGFFVFLINEPDKLPKKFITRNKGKSYLSSLIDLKYLLVCGICTGTLVNMLCLSFRYY